MRFAACLRLLLVVVLPALFAIAPAAAQSDLSAHLKRFTADSFAETIQALEGIAASGAPHAADIVVAAAAGRLKFDEASGAVFYQDAAGAWFSAADGRPAAAPAGELKPVRLNNRVRGVIDNLRGALTLRAPDRGKRLAAAAALFKSRDAKALPQLDAALAAEKDAAVKDAFVLARAAIVVGMAEAPEAARLDAVSALGLRADREALSVLRAAAPTDNPAIRAAAVKAADGIESRLAMLARVQDLIYGLSLGSVLLLAAIGLAITFGVMGVINMAHGEMVMLGAYTTFVVQEAIRVNAPHLFDWSLAIAIPLAFLVTGAIGVAIERGVIRFLYGRPLETLLATFGVSLVLQQAVRTAFGPTNREVGAPAFMSGSFDLFGLTITLGRMWIVAFTLLVFAILLVVLKATPLGLQMRAVTQNRRMASAMGIRTGFVDAMTFGLGSGIAGLAGVALSQIDNVSPNLGQGYIIDSFIVVVFGGVGNLWGTFAGAFTLGIANKFLEPVAGAVLGKILILVLIILFIQKRPRGLFALKGRAVEQ